MSDPRRTGPVNTARRITDRRKPNRLQCAFAWIVLLAWALFATLFFIAFFSGSHIG